MLAAASAGAMYNKDSSADTVALDRPLSPATPSPPQFRKAPTFSAWAAPSPLPGFSASSNTFFTGGADDDAAYAQRFIKVGRRHIPAPCRRLRSRAEVLNHPACGHCLRFLLTARH